MEVHGQEGGPSLLVLNYYKDVVLGVIGPKYFQIQFHHPSRACNLEVTRLVYAYFCDVSQGIFHVQ